MQTQEVENTAPVQLPWVDSACPPLCVCSLQKQRQRAVIPVLLGALSICDTCLVSQGWEANNTTIWKRRGDCPQDSSHIPSQENHLCPGSADPFRSRTAYLFVFISTRTVWTLLCLLVFSHLYIWLTIEPRFLIDKLL